MSTKGKQLSTKTREKISLAKTRITKSALITAGQNYLDRLANNPKELPTLTGFCLEANISRSHLAELAHKYSEVMDIIEKLEQMQEQYCLTNGITNKANPIFSMFILKSKHNFKDQPQKLEQNNYLNVSPELLADALKLMKD